MPGSLGFLKPDLPEAASTALNPVSRATGFTLFGFDLKIERCCRTNIAVFLPFLLSFSPTHTHTPFPTLTEKLTEFPDELEGKGTQLTSHDARGSCESAAENQVKMLITGNKMPRRQARREEKALGKRKEVSESRGWGWERLSLQPGEQASPPASRPARPGHWNSAAPVGLFAGQSEPARVNAFALGPWHQSDLRPQRLPS